MRRSTLLAASLVAVVGAVIIATQLSVTRSGIGVNSAHACTGETEIDHGKCLPKVEYIDTEGKFWTPEELEGKVVMVNFWATWCRPCLAEVPALSSVYQRYKDAGFVLLGVMRDNVDAPALARFRAMTGLSYPVIPTNDNLLIAYGDPSALPTTFIYDRYGALQFSHRGPVSEGELSRIIANLLEKK